MRPWLDDVHENMHQSLHEELRASLHRCLPKQCCLCASTITSDAHVYQRYSAYDAGDISVHGATPTHQTYANHSSTSQLCGACRAQLPYLSRNGHGYCHGCGRALTIRAVTAKPVHCGACQRRPSVLDNVIVPCEYAWPMTHLIQQFKFGKRVGMAMTFAQLIATHWQERLCDEMLTESACVEGGEDDVRDERDVGELAGKEIKRREPTAFTTPDVFLPIALHTRRFRYRGYNQSAALAKALGRLLDVPVNNDVLHRVRYTQPQHTLSFTARKKAVRACFALRNPASIKGAHIGLVDDVMTSGETLFAAAKLLKKHGAAHVSAWLIARTQW